MFQKNSRGNEPIGVQASSGDLRKGKKCYYEGRDEEGEMGPRVQKEKKKVVPPH